MVNKEYFAKKKREWRIKNPLKNCYYIYKSEAKRKANKFELSFEELKTIIRKPCHYCGDLLNKYNGIDRMDNTKGYIYNNCVPCCKLCNFKKGAMKYKDFLEWIERVYEYRRGNQVEVYSTNSLQSSLKTINLREPHPLKTVKNL